MRASLLLAGVVALFATPLLGFPSLAGRDLTEEQLIQFRELSEKIKTDLAARKKEPLEKRDGAFIGSVVQNTGKYAWKAPGPNDIRGPCPGLNILANHGYISRTGVDTVPAIIAASQKVFGMALDLGTFLTVYSAVIAGDLLTVSIGGNPPNTGLLSAVGLIGAPTGLSNSHYRFESDVSPTRADLYVSKNAWSLDIPRFTDLYNSGPGPNGYDLSIMLAHRQRCFKKSVAENPYFFNGPFTGLAIQTATYLFTYRFFANYSTGSLDAYLSGETLKSFEGVTGEPGSFVFKTGYERIPDNWYRRPAIAEYGIPSFIQDAAYTLTQVPELFAIGGNTGTRNTWVGVNLTDLTGGVYNADTVLTGNYVMCLAFQAVESAAPDMVRGLLKNVAAAVTMLVGALEPVLGLLDCPAVSKFDRALFSQYPGAQDGI